VTKLFLSIFLIASIAGRAASTEAALSQAAPSQDRRADRNPLSTPDQIPHSVFFREVSGRGLIVRTWVNGIGPFNFAIDTGAGAILIGSRVADEARVTRKNARPVSIAGLSGATRVAYPASLQSLSIGDIDNYLPAKGEVVIADGLPPDLDGVLDPTEALSPLGFTIDIPAREFAAFDPKTEPLRPNQAPADGAVVPWVRDAHGRRPFVTLDNGDRALLDTGSSLGLVLRDPSVSRTSDYRVRDVGGGQISSRRVTTATIAIGSLSLQRIPTDLVSGAEADAPVLLGLTALRPFRIRFDPLHRLIEIAPSAPARRG
jgi:predicted aspartyl protease